MRNKTVLIFLICFVSILVIFHSWNARLNSHIKALENNVVSLNVALRQYQIEAKARDKIEEESLNYLKWRFILKDQVELAYLRLTGKAEEMKNLRGDKAMANLVYYNLGLACVLSSDFESAVKAFEEALKFNPKDAESYYNLGLLYSAYKNNSNKAIECYNRYLEINPAGTKSDYVKKQVEILKNRGKP